MRSSGGPLPARPQRAPRGAFLVRPDRVSLRRALVADRAAVSPVVGTILMVAITVVLVALLYVIVAGFITNPGSGPQSIGLVVASASGNWSVTIVSVPGGKLPASTFVVIRDSNYTILFPRTPFENLTAARWTSQKVLYQDAHPS